MLKCRLPKAAGQSEPSMRAVIIQPNVPRDHSTPSSETRDDPVGGPDDTSSVSRSDKRSMREKPLSITGFHTFGN